MGDDVRRGIGPWLLSEAGVSNGEKRALSLPMGTVTFLLADVEGSGRRWEMAPEAMAAAIPRSYELLDGAIVDQGGVRLADQSKRDGVVAAFGRASDAVVTAISAQRAFATEVWPPEAEVRVRMAVHTGDAQLRDEGFFLGHIRSRCARIRDVGHGGQVLLSAATAALIADRLPNGATLEDLGQHRLKDLGRSQNIWQVVDADLPSSFPPLRSLDAFRHNLPVQLTPLIGRDAEVLDLRRLLDGERLVTLTGSGGVGKTRLALAVGADVLELYPGGVWWVELAQLAEQSGVGRAALAALSSRAGPGAQVVDQLAFALGDQPSLLVLDNCEHLIAACAELVTDLLSANPSTSVLTTSREPLSVPGEITWRVPSMRCPNIDGTVDGTVDGSVDVRALSQYDAVLLFVERARRARPSFQVSEANAPAIAEICYRLDGIPLALELAAARCRQMSAERIATELDDRFRLLTGGARTVVARQQTLAASVAWSHDRLGDDERTAFRRLGVFAGPFLLEAAEAVVAAPGGVDPAEVFDLLSRLVDKSLVVVEDGPAGEPRYRQLETLRAFALDQAVAAGELTTVRTAHARWWADWVEPRGHMPTDDILEEIEEFHANLKAALDWSTDDPALGLRLLRALCQAWLDLGRAGDAMAAADRLLTDDNAQHHSAEWLPAAWGTASLCFHTRGPAAMVAFLERMELIAARHGNEFYRLLARCQKEPVLSNVTWRQLASEQGDRYFDAWVPLQAALELADDDPVAAISVLAGADADPAAAGMRSLRELSRLARAEVACSTGDLITAIELTSDLLERPFSSLWGDAVRLVSFAALLAEDESALRGAVEIGERTLRASPGLAVWSDKGAHRLGLLHGRPSVANDSREQHPPTCSTLWLVGRESIDAGSPRVAVDKARYWARPEPHPRAVVAAIEGAATGDEDRWHDALAVALDHGLRLIAVDALEGLAAAAGRAESWAESLRLLGAAERLRDETGYRWRFPFERRSVDDTRSNAVDALGDQAAAATAEGRHLDWLQAGAYARRARGERKRPHHGWASLTPTEHRVVALVAEGMTNVQIAEHLFMGRATVKTHLEHIFTKLGIRSRAALASEATRRR